MPNRQVPIHYLRPNHTAWTPPSVISFDTETYTTEVEGNEVMTMRLWCARFTDRRAPRRVTPVDEWADGLSPEDMALQFHKWTSGRKTIWAYAHNLHFDLSVSGLVDELVWLGWQVTDFAVDGGSPFVRMSLGERHLTICDSFSWLPTQLANVGHAVGIVKPPLPKADDSHEAWLYRCRSDVEILSEAIMILMDWWQRESLGRWTITGSASGWNAMRHIPTPERILIRPDESEVNFDRKAIYGGRRYVWRAGKLSPSRYIELDIERAYTAVCRDLPLPTERMASFDSLPLDHRWLDCTRHGVIAEVLLDTDTPRWPARANGVVWYPVGQFWTVLAGPDIRAARELGCLKAVGHGWLHGLGYPLRPWAEWCIRSQAEGAEGVPDVARITLRAWGRSVVGKWAQRGHERIRLGPSPTTEWQFTEAWDHGGNVRASIVDFGGWRWQVAATQESDNAYPAILAFVESYVRVALGNIIDVLGTYAMIACDTDGLIIDANKATMALNSELGPSFRGIPAGKRLDALIGLASQSAEPLHLREKRVYHRVSIIGPQHMELDERKRFAGIPSHAEKQEDGRYLAWIWPKLAWQMRNGRPHAFVRPPISYKIASTYVPGWVTTDGTVRPIVMATDTTRANRIIPYPATRYAAAGLKLAPHQHKILGGYREG